MARILIIEDNPDLAEGLRVNLELENHVVEVCTDGGQALINIAKLQPDLIILDVLLPNQDGFGILQKMRQNSLNIPVLMLTARGEETDKVRALRLGADDYVTKPFGLLELIARVEALLRRSGSVCAPVTGRKTIFGTVEFDPATRRVWREGELVSLTPKETNLLLVLVEKPNHVWSRQELLQKVWGHAAEVASRTVDTHIAELRRKLEIDPAMPQFIQTARSAGYWLNTDPRSSRNSP
ncbi:MAG: response regulator transcription factor [Gammaproteobacteria bacterium]|nr:response regulator transcription factor [Gammaproteobacteria bacterium]